MPVLVCGRHASYVTTYVSGGSGGGGGSDLTTFTFRETSGGAQTEVPVRIPLSFAKGVVTSSEKVVVYKADDTLADAQVDQIANWPDGSIEQCVARAWIPSISGSGAYTFKIKKAVGSRSQTPAYAGSDISSGWNIKCQFQNFKNRNGDVIGSGTYTASLNDNISNSLYTRTYAGGPQSVGFRSWARTKDETGGAERFHMPVWFYAEIWKKPSTSTAVLCVMANPRSNPWFTTDTKAVGGVHYAQPRLLNGATELLNRNTALLTFTDADCNTVSNYITKTGHGLQEGQIVRVSTSGTLPGSLEADQYYRVVLGGTSSGDQATNRFRLIFNSVTGTYPNYANAVASTDRITNTVSGHSCRTGQAYRSQSNSGRGVSDGVYFARVIDGDSITLHPTSADAVAGTNTVNITSDGSFSNDNHESRSSLSPAGSGTHTLSGAIGAHGRSGFFMADSDGDEVWIGIAKPTIIPELTNAELSYQIASGLLPPVDRALTANSFDTGYVPMGIGPWRYGINDTGPHPMIGFWPTWAEHFLINKGVSTLKTVKSGGLTMSHVYNFWYLEDTQVSSVEQAVPVTMNNGPARDGVAYSGMGPVRKNYSDYSTAGGSRPARDYGPDGPWTESTGQDASHWPCAALPAYLITGCYWYADLHVNAPLRHLLYPGGNQYKEDTLGGVVYYNRVVDGEYQLRGRGWLLRDLGGAALCPDDMPERAPLIDAVKDNTARINYGWLNTYTQANKDWGLDGTGTGGTTSPWMMTYQNMGLLFAMHAVDQRGTYSAWADDRCIKMHKSLCDTVPSGVPWKAARGPSLYRCFIGSTASVYSLPHFYGTAIYVNFNSDHTLTMNNWGDVSVSNLELVNGDVMILTGSDSEFGGPNPPAGVSKVTKYYVGDWIAGTSTFKLYTDEARTTQLTWAAASQSNVAAGASLQTTLDFGDLTYARPSAGLLYYGKLVGITGLATAITNADAEVTGQGGTSASDRQWDWLY